jgi:hypothetical protein
LVFGSITATEFGATAPPPVQPWPSAKIGIAIAAAATPIRAEPAARAGVGGQRPAVGPGQRRERFADLDDALPQAPGRNGARADVGNGR